jgi:hypothetical protein
MMRSMVAVIGALALTGCGLLGNLLGPKRTTVRLVNDGGFNVEATIYISDNQNVPEALLTELGTELSYTIPPGETVSFSRDCDQLQAIVVDNADLEVIGQMGPQASSDVLRDGSDFFCGDTIVFTFDHSVLLVDFNVTASVQP